MRTPAFRRLCAKDELMLPILSQELALELLPCGLAREDAQAVAENTALLYLAIDWKSAPAKPAALLRFYTLDEIAALCRDYRDFLSGELEYGENEGWEARA